MFFNYLKLAWRNLQRNKAYGFVNIFGLATGMALVVLIGLWIYDEVSYNKNFQNYERVGQLWQFVKFDKEKSSYNSLPIPLSVELREKYPEFEAVSMSTYTKDVVLSFNDKKFTKTGNFTEPDFAKILSLKMLAGTSASLSDMNSILLSRSLAKTFFGSEDPLNKIIRLDNKQSATVTGIYEDFPDNSSFRETSFIAPWKLFVAGDSYAKRVLDQWDENSFQIFVQLKEGASFADVSNKIRDIRMKRADPPGYKPEFFIHPMSKWHLYGDFKNGVNTGGLIYFVWLFGVIGGIVLLLACINFMNLSTARSERRAKEVGVRKTIGSLRKQLVFQFLSESVLITLLAFVFSLLFVLLSLPFFNEIADKKINIPWTSSMFWISGLTFCLLTGMIAGSYPALYLSSFKPLKVLKGTFTAGRFASLPRKVLVVFQFTVSIALVIGIITVFRQINHAKNRPANYSRTGLIEINMTTPDLYGHYDAIRNDLLRTGAVNSFSESRGSITSQYGGTVDFQWKGKDPNTQPLFMSNQVTHDFGRTVAWQLVLGRDFSREFPTDTSAMILNEAAIKIMGLENPLNETVRRNGRPFKIIGVIKDMIRASPFEPIQPTFFTLDYTGVNVLNIKLAERVSTSSALAKVEAVLKKYNPQVPFEYNFVDQAYAKKFDFEERIGKLAIVFTVLALIISCLGLFALASYVAEQRTKEIGIRKVLGATITNLWHMQSRDFLLLVLISCVVAVPISIYFLDKWLQNYEYRIGLPWWVFAFAGLSAMTISLFTVSFQAIKAALANPVKSLRTE